MPVDSVMYFWFVLPRDVRILRFCMHRILRRIGHPVQNLGSCAELRKICQMVVMDDLKISKLDRFQFDFFIKNLDFDFRFEFLLYLLRHFSDTCLWSITNGRPIRRSVRSAHIKRSENLMRARSIPIRVWPPRGVSD